MKTNLNYKAWSNKNCVDYYASKRHVIDDIYDSEKFFILPIITNLDTVLDIGCAAGGFSKILKSLNPNIHYIGLDTSKEMINKAKILHPDEKFILGNGDTIDFPDNTFDLVLCTSVMHHVPHYKKLISEIYRVSRKFVILDLPRITTEDVRFNSQTDKMNLKNRFPGLNENFPKEETIVPYVFVNINEIYSFLFNDLQPKPAALASTGYFGEKIHNSVNVPVSQFCFNVILLIKNNRDNPYTLTYIDLPIDYKESLESNQFSYNIKLEISLKTILNLNS